MSLATILPRCYRAPESGGITQLIVAYDARPLQPETRHWGPGVVVENILARLSGDYRFVGIAHWFQNDSGWPVRSWPTIPRMGKMLFELSPLFAGRFDLYWGTNHFLPEALQGPSVLTVHDLLLLNHMDSRRQERFLGWRFSSALRRAGEIVADSRTTADDLLALFSELRGKVRVVLQGFDIPPPVATEGSASKGWSDAPYVLMLGAHRPRKNLNLALAATARLVDAGVNVRLLITGDVHPSFEESLNCQPHNVQRLGVLPREELWGLLRGAMALFFPSRYEGFGFPMLEAMAAGCPVLALDNPINREIAGAAARFLPEDPVEWAEACRTLMESPSLRTEMKERGIENLTRFSWDRTAALYGEIFREVANSIKL